MFVDRRGNRRTIKGPRDVIVSVCYQEKSNKDRRWCNVFRFNSRGLSAERKNFYNFERLAKRRPSKNVLRKQLKQQETVINDNNHVREMDTSGSDF